MNFWLLLISYGVFQGIFLIFFFCFTKKVEKTQKGLLILLVTSLTILLADYVFSSYNMINEKKAFFGIGWSGPFWFLITPLYYFLSRSFLFKNQVVIKKQGLHFFPFFISLIYSIPFFILPADARQEYFTSYALGQEIALSHIVSKVVYHIQLLVYPILIFRMMNQKSMNTINFISITNFGLLFIGVSSFAHMISFNFFKLNISWFTSIFVFVSLTIFIHSTAFLLIARPDWIIKPIKEILLKYTNSNLTSIDVQRLRYELQLLMQQQKIYLQRNLKLVDVSNELSITTHQLSEFLNQENNQSFNNYINSYRIKDAQELLINLESNFYTIEAIAYESGFKSTATFYRCFKKLHNVSPSEWLKTKQK